MNTSPWIIDVDEEGFAEQVLQRSGSVPILVDFWATWCGPCRTLGPILEKLAMEMNGRFLLAKIDSDKNPALSQQYGVRGIPAVKLFINGAMANEFSGALPESAVRKFLDQAIPPETDRLAREGRALEQQGKQKKALAHYQSALDIDPQHSEALLGMTRLLLAAGDPESAQQTFDRLTPKAAQDVEAKTLRAKLTFAGAGDNLETLQTQVKENPANLEARLALGQALVGVERFVEGLDQFLEIVREDRQFQEDAGRKAVLQVFDLLGPGHPLVAPYRTRLSALLFS